MPYKITDITIDKDKKGEIRDIPVQKKRATKKNTTKQTPDEPSVPQADPHPMMDDDTPGIGKVKFYLIGVLLIIAFVCIIVWTINPQATVSIMSQQAYIEVEELPIQSAIAIPLNYTYATSTKVSSYQTIQQKSSGKVTFYNEFSTSAQTLNIKTKLKTASGLVYYTKSAVTVPGYKKSGTKIIPGTIQVSVEAEKAGSNYNVSSGQKLTIANYAGTTRGTKLYVKSGGITGGSTEKKPVFSNKTEESAETTALQYANSLFADSLRGIQDEPGVIAAYSSSTLETKVTNTAGASGSGTTTVTVSGVAYRIEQAQIVSALISKYRAKIREQMSDTVDIDVTSLGADSIGGAGNISIVNGNPVIEKGTWRIYTKYDPENIKRYIQGKNIQTALNAIHANSHSRAEISINPFWVRTLPKHLEQIHVEFKR